MDFVGSAHARARVLSRMCTCCPLQSYADFDDCARTQTNDECSISTRYKNVFFLDKDGSLYNQTMSHKCSGGIDYPSCVNVQFNYFNSTARNALFAAVENLAEMDPAGVAFDGMFFDAGTSRTSRTSRTQKSRERERARARERERENLLCFNI